MEGDLDEPRARRDSSISEELEIPVEYLRSAGVDSVQTDISLGRKVMARPSEGNEWSSGSESAGQAQDSQGQSPEAECFRRSGRMSTSSSFIKASVRPRRPSAQINLIAMRTLQVLNSSIAESVIGALIVFNFVLICMETDSRSDYPGRGTGEVSQLVSDLQVGCFGIFCIELLLRIFAEGTDFHKRPWNLLDAFIIIIGTVDYLLVLSGLDTGAVSVIRVARLCRLLRLVRVMRLFTILKELRRLLQMMGSCFKTLFWSFLLLVLVMTMWAIIAVEVVNPVVQRAADAGAWPDCERCRRSFASVFMANITFFQTVVAGDSWGYVAIPVIELEPMTAVVFIGSLLTLIFGVLNLIVAVIVDTFAESREKDVLARAAELDEEEKEQKKILENIFSKVDTDNSGSLSYQELLEGAARVPDFNRWLRVMDIDTGDLEQLFKIVDADGSGEIEPTEFIEAMYRMKTADAKTATKFVKHIVTRLDEKTTQLEDKVASTLPDMAKIDKRVKERLKRHEKKLQETVERAVLRASEASMKSAVEAIARAAAGGSTFGSPMSSPPHSPRRSVPTLDPCPSPARRFAKATTRSGDFGFALTSEAALPDLSLEPISADDWPGLQAARRPRPTMSRPFDGPKADLVSSTGIVFLPIAGAGGGGTGYGRSEGSQGQASSRRSDTSPWSSGGGSRAGSPSGRNLNNIF